MRCLRRRREGLSEKCRQALFATEVEQASSPSALNAALQSACLADTKRRCHDVTPGEDAVVYCLWRARAELATPCLEEVKATARRIQQDVRLNTQVQRYCRTAIETLCEVEL